MSYFSFVVLIVDLLMNLTGVVLGGILAFRAHDNRLKLIWGIMVALCSLSMFIDNIGWLERFTYGFGLEERSSLLIFSRMMKWYFFVHILTLFPIASLKPGWLTSLRILLFSLPLLFSTLICWCYLWFNGTITPVYSMAEVFQHIRHTDVQLRLGYFILSVVGPVCYFLIPFTGKWIVLKRKMNPGMYFYLVGMCTILVLYVLFITGTTDTLFTVYGFMVTFLPNVFTVLYLFNENPISAYRSPAEGVCLPVSPGFEQNSVPAAVYNLHRRMVEYLDESKPYVDPKYDLLQLSSELHVKRSTLVKAIQYAGFSGFNEFVNYLRLEYFKELVASSSNPSIKELMFKSGFNSRSSFYRHFSALEQMSPKEYILHVLSGK